MNQDDVLARMEIEDVVNRYCHATHLGRAADCLSLFTADGVFEVRERDADGNVTTRARISGRDALDKFFSDSMKPFVTCPLVHNLVIDVHGNSAVGRSIMTAAAGGGYSKWMGIWEDEFRREPGWLIASRVFTIVGWSHDERAIATGG